MENMTMFEDTLTGELFVIIDRGNGEFTSMPKSTHDELKANEAKTIDEPATKSK